MLAFGSLVLGLVWGAVAGMLAGAAYGGLFGGPPGGLVGGCVGGIAGAGLGILSGIGVAIATALRPVSGRVEFASLVRGVTTGVPAVLGTAIFFLVEIDRDPVGGVLLLYVVPFAIASLVAWFLAPFAVRPLLRFIPTAHDEGRMVRGSTKTVR